MALSLALSGFGLLGRPEAGAAAKGVDAVVVATFDTGTNPFHPCFRRDQTNPVDVVADYPSDAIPLGLTFAEDYRQSLEKSKPALDRIRPWTLHYVPGTNLSFYGSDSAKTEFVDDYPHGSQASSQIACERYGMAPDAQLVILNWYDDRTQQHKLTRWVARQPWIDVVHFNIQDLPTPLASADGIKAVISAGKLVVIAAGNGVAGAGVNYPMELSHYNGPPGSLIAGANDNGGYAFFSNLNPHVVMDGEGTVAAAPDSYGDDTFNGTSSASPRITGYVARLLYGARLVVGHSGRGLLTIPRGSPRPQRGALSDGRLSAGELHEIVRKTANPNPHDSRYDGTSFLPIPQPVDLPFAFYPKMGYGEVSERTIDAALDVLLGRAPLPERPFEDRFYEQSEELRRRLWQ